MARVSSGRSISLHKRVGFTLIELLTVISVIAVLLAVLLPVLSWARTQAKRAGCGSNLRQIALAWAAYLDDHEGYFYQGITANVDYGGWKGSYGWWPRPLNKYVGLDDPNGVTEAEAKVFCCPSDRGGVPGFQSRTKAYRLLGTSYQTNIFLIGQNRCSAFSDHTADLDQQISQRLPDLNRSDVANPSRLLLIGDYGWINQWKPKPHSDMKLKDLAEWHRRADCHNLAFLDGHVKLLNIRKGFYVTDEYCVLPFQDLFESARKVQRPIEVGE